MSQHHAVACFGGCPGPWTVAFPQELLFKLMLSVPRESSVVILSCRHACTGWPCVPGDRTAASRRAGVPRATRHTLVSGAGMWRQTEYSWRGLSGPQIRQRRALQLVCSPRLDEQFFQVLDHPYTSSGSPPIRQGI